MTLKSALISISLVVFGTLFGMVLSDAAAMRGFPHKPYMVEFLHDGSYEANFRCQQIATMLQGQNFSTLNPISGKQERCSVVLYGEARADGTFDAYSSTQTWFGRYEKGSRPAHFAQEQIKSATEEKDTLKYVSEMLWDQFVSNF
jgi:hypothetical protein